MQKQEQKILINTLLLKLSGVVLFPGNVMHIDIKDEQSTFTLDKAMESDQIIAILPTYYFEDGEELPNTFGVLCRIRQIQRVQNSAVRILVEGISRINIVNTEKNDEIN